VSGNSHKRYRYDRFLHVLCITLQRHLRALTQFFYVESWFYGRRRHEETAFDALRNPCVRRACFRSVAVGINPQLNDVQADFREDIDPHGIEDLVVVALAHRLSLRLSASSHRREGTPGRVPHVSHACPATCKTPLNTCTRNTIAQESRAICDILATHVETVRKSRSGKGSPPNTPVVHPGPAPLPTCVRTTPCRCGRNPRIHHSPAGGCCASTHAC
jgi:hypothetical protein